MKKTLSFYGSHDASVTFFDKNEKLRVLEYERFSGIRYGMYSDKYDGWPLSSNIETKVQFLDYVKSMINQEIELVIYNELTDTDIFLLKNYFPLASFKKKGHHRAHAACAYYQSEFNDALVFSLDGGGWDNSTVSMSKVFRGIGETLTEIDDPKIDLGNPYGLIGCPISEIKPGRDGSENSLSYAGKIMGLCAYGKVREQWIEPMFKFYSHQSLKLLGLEIGLNLELNSLEGENSYDLAATSQFVFENLAFNLIQRYYKEYNTNIVMTGGCALNVLFNQRLKEILWSAGKDLYIPPNPNDCGLSLGQFLDEHPHRPEKLTYNGWDLIDKDKLPKYVEEYQAKQVTEKEIVQLISDQKIVGLVFENSEVGPRALGNRSIICDPSFSDMKDMLNAKVKFREWFRPFAPVSRLQDGPKYFENCPESIYMSYAPKVKKEYHEKLRAITHADSTSRLQTVTYEQHQIFYNILSEMDKIGKIPVILNTSFNILGKPILTTIKDAIYVLENTALDHVVIEGFLFSKKIA